MQWHLTQTTTAMLSLSARAHANNNKRNNCFAWIECASSSKASFRKQSNISSRAREREKASREVNNFWIISPLCGAGISLEKWRCIHRHQIWSNRRTKANSYNFISNAFVLLCVCAFERPLPCNMIEYDYYYEFSLVELESLANANNSIAAYHSNVPLCARRVLGECARVYVEMEQ